MKAEFPAETGPGGRFERQQDAFRGWITEDGSSGFPLEAGRYHLYVSWACPWAHRTIITRQLMGLEEAIGMTAVHPLRDARGWAFVDEADPVEGFHFLSEAYRRTEPQFEGRYTVPVLWDKVQGRIVSNSDDDLMRMFATTFRPLASHPQELVPAELLPQLEARNAWLHETINDGVYRAGFATGQEAYEAAAYRLFAALDELEALLATRRYLLAPHPVESDWRLFVTLVRFDAVYVGHFKCNLRRIVDYPQLWGYLRDLYQVPGIAGTVRLDQVKQHYYLTHRRLNPMRLLPIGPELDFTTPHGREHLS